MTLGYDPDDVCFINLVKAIVLGTSAYFSYEPTELECK